MGNIPWIGKAEESSSMDGYLQYSRQEEGRGDSVSARMEADDWSPHLCDEGTGTRNELAEGRYAGPGPTVCHESGGSVQMNKQALAREAAAMVPCIDHSSCSDAERAVKSNEM